ncbi:MAG: ABC transporter permease [Acidobacteria bacterium]|nr:ABC transporter permease [Acidobacteriota bacterium]
MRWFAKAWASVLKDARIDASYRVAFVLEAFDGLLMLVAYGFLAGLFGGRVLDGYAPLGFLLVGVAANSALTTALVYFAQAVRGVQAAGAIKILLTTPTPPLEIVVLSSIYPFLRAGVDLVVWLSAAALLGAPLVGLTAGGVVATGVVFVTAAVAMAGFGFLAAAFAIVFKRGDPIVWILGAANMLLSGVLYPTSSLPTALATVGQWLPATHALNAMRDVLLGGESLVGVWPELLTLAAFGAVGIPLGLGALLFAIRYARQEGTVGHV